MNLKKLKESARKHEQKEDWPTAVKIYLRAIEASESGLEPVPDLSLYNRVGDLYMKLNDAAQAVKTYERAVDLYADQGFANNAIAICGKILRVNPGRMHTYLTLAKLYARKNFVVDAKKNLLEYLDRMNKANRRDEAFREVSGFAHQFHGEAEIRDMLRELVQAASRETHSGEQLDKLAAQLEAGPAGATTGGVGVDSAPSGRGRRPGELVFLDTSAALPAEPLLEPLPEVPEPPVEAPPEPPVQPPEVSSPTSDLPLIDLGDEASAETMAPDTGLELEEEFGDEGVLDADAVSEQLADDVPELEGVEPTALAGDDSADVEVLEGLEVGGGITIEDQLGVEEQELEEGVEPTILDGVELESVPTRLEDLEVAEFEDLDGAEPGPVTMDEQALEPEAAAEVGSEEQEVELQPVDEVEELDTVGSWDTDAPEFVEEAEQTDQEPAEEAWAEEEDVQVEEPAPALPWLSGEETAGDLEDSGLAVVEPIWADEDAVEVEAEAEAEEKAAEPLEVSGFAEEAVEQDEFPEYAAPAVEEMPPSLPEWAPQSFGTTDLGQVDIVGLEQQLAQSPNDPFTHRALGEGLITAGSKERGLYELELALAGFEARQDWGRSTDVLRGLVRLDPNRIWYYQKRVELAFRSGEKGRLVEAYLELGDVLVRVGSLEKALAVYGRVLEHDPANEFASAALDVLRPVRPADVDQPAMPSRRHAPDADADADAERTEEQYVDLGALVLEPRPRRDTRIRVEDEEPTGDEERDFELMLEQFKAALEESLTDEDYQAHYDLGVAFKEMGLLDEAIAEFQKALRAPEGRLRTSEALGVSFYEKGQYAVAEAILRRAVDGISGLDDEKIGLLYWLGRSTESLGRVREALKAYERAMAVDVGFMDINERVRRLEAGSA